MHGSTGRVQSLALFILTLLSLEFLAKKKLVLRWLKKLGALIQINTDLFCADHLHCGESCVLFNVLLGNRVSKP
jgi:hypothetical protein